MESKNSYQAYHKRFSKAESNKGSILENLKECYRYAMPAANVDGYDNGSNTIDDSPEVFDDTAITALKKYANKTQSQIIPSWKTWAILEAGSEIPKEERADINRQLEDITDIIFDHINHSNFLSATHEAFKDLGISTGALIVEEGDGIQSSLNFRAMPMMELIPERSSDGKIRTVWRKFKLEANRITELYPAASLTGVITAMIQNNPEEMVELIEGTVFDVKKRMFNHVLLFPAQAEKLMDVVTESSPNIVFRESSLAGQAFGDGRVLSIIGTILKLNKLSYYEDVSVGIN
ncbi:MAG: hypothetical protein DRP97_03005, partial [Candidatus Latescibacterota bacterium]